MHRFTNITYEHVFLNGHSDKSRRVNGFLSTYLGETETKVNKDLGCFCHLKSSDSQSHTGNDHSVVLYQLQQLVEAAIDHLEETKQVLT